MMKKFLVLLALLAGTSVSAQDTIIKMNGSEVFAKVVFVDDQNVEYEKRDSAIVHHYVVPRSEIFMIKYAGGKRELIYKKSQPAPDARPVSAEGYTILQVHPVVGDTIDSQERKMYGVFPDYYYSRKEFVRAWFLQKPGGQIIVRAVLTNGKVIDRISSQKELDRVRGKISHYHRDRGSDAGIAIGVAGATFAAIILSVVLLVEALTN